ncbi:FAD-dependent thymidylate synthase [bacterium]|nr:FAD-dependent thymidylate synthase [bacterium]
MLRATVTVDEKTAEARRGALKPAEPVSVASPRRWTAPDGVGFVELLDTFGDDLTVVNAARVSFAKESAEMCERDGKLIKYLADHHHVTPFFHPQARFRIKMPIFVAREWYRHQIGFARNEVSRRYVDSRPECWTPANEDLRARDPRAKQGSRPDPIAEAAWSQARIEKFQREAVAFYEELLGVGVAPEIARCVLPQSMYTEFIETGSLAAYARLCGLRLGPDAQREIQAYAGAVSELMEGAFPVSWQALSPSKGSD